MSVSLSKGQSVSLKKADGSGLTQIILGLGWDPVKKGFFSKGGSVDLDASAILYHESGDAESVYYGKLNSSDGAVRHGGDNLTGDGDGDDERIFIDLAKVSPAVKAIVLTINSFSGHTFNQVENVTARVVDASSGREVEVVRYNLAESKNSTATIIAKLVRGPGGWDFAAIGEFADGKTVSSLVEPGRRFL